MPTTSPGAMRLRIELLERLVDDHGIAVLGGRGRGQDVKPAGCNDRDAERKMTRIDQVNAHWP